MTAELRRQMDPEALARALLDIAEGRLPPGISSDSTVSIKNRLIALELIWNRCEGSPIKQTIAAHLSANVSLPVGWDGFTTEAKGAWLDDLRQRALTGGGR